MYLSQNSPTYSKGRTAHCTVVDDNTKREAGKGQVNLRIPFTPKRYACSPSYSERWAQAFSNSSSSRSSRSSRSSMSSSPAGAGALVS